jgi:trimethylamine-N-oxide reductase cytochrome c-type subunit TorC
MKFIFKVVLLCLVSLSLQASSYIYLEVGVKLPLEKVTLYGGTPVKVLANNGEYSEVIVKGFVDKKDKTKLYATKNMKLLLASAKEGFIKIDGDKGTIKALVSNDNLSGDSDEAWDLYSSRFYEKCTQCHPAKVVGDHTMLEWEGLYGSMKEFAKPTQEDDEYISRFLRAFAKDGILKEED